MTSMGEAWGKAQPSAEVKSATFCDLSTLSHGFDLCFCALSSGCELCPCLCRLDHRCASGADGVADRKSASAEMENVSAVEVMATCAGPARWSAGCGHHVGHRANHPSASGYESARDGAAGCGCDRAAAGAAANV